jgi:O-antigen/teichoic acid export membrane protein
MANTGVLAVLGFVFWAIASRFYATTAVGVMAAVIAGASMISSLSLLGFDSAFIRFLPGSEDTSDHLDTGIALTAVMTLLLSTVYLVVIRLFIPHLGIMTSSWVYIASFMAFMVLNTLNNITNFAFIAIRSAHLIAIVNLGFGVLRLVGLVVLARFGLDGMLLSQAIAVLVAVLMTFWLMGKHMHYVFRPRIVTNAFRQVKSYTFNSYISGTLLVLPALLLPTIVISELGPASSAYYYIVSVLITALNVIPLAVSQSLFAEGTWEPRLLTAQLAKAAKATSLLLVPTTLLLVVMAHTVLGLFGQDYAQSATTLLIVLVISAIPKAANYVLSTVLRLDHKLPAITAINGVYAFIVLAGTAACFKLGAGLIAIGLVTLAAELIAVALNAGVLYHYKNVREPEAESSLYAHV